MHRTFFLIALAICFVSFVGCTDQQVVENLQNENTSLRNQVETLVQDTTKASELGRRLNEELSLKSKWMEGLREDLDWYVSRSSKEDLLIWSVDSSSITKQIDYLSHLDREVNQGDQETWAKWFIHQSRYVLDIPGQGTLTIAKYVLARKSLMSVVWTAIKPIIVGLVKMSDERDLVLRKAQCFRSDIAWNSPANTAADSIRRVFVESLPTRRFGETLIQNDVENWYDFQQNFWGYYVRTCSEAGLTENDVDFVTLKYRWQERIAQANGDFDAWHREVLRIIDEFIEAIR